MTGRAVTLSKATSVRSATMSQWPVSTVAGGRARVAARWWPVSTVANGQWPTPVAARRWPRAMATRSTVAGRTTPESMVRQITKTRAPRRRKMKRHTPSRMELYHWLAVHTN